ncbi:MAG: prephenate dehydrogenase/arogenate dehydrogenase family protein [Syntrophales bacterium]|nr:prephenate dehydrogenase/arogenate dehydrogenase family protein [Syntrophales bacterium]
MNNIQIGIIGGTGGMGRWFADFFVREGYTVHVSGRSRGMDVRKMADTCQVVIVSVPIGVTGEVIEKVGPCMKKESLLMDLTSLKEEPVRAMVKFSVSEVIGCHPLFGPHVDSIAGHRVVLCPERTERWLAWLKAILEKNGALVVETTPAKHDAMMAIVQGFNHLNTITMGAVLGKAGVSLSELNQFATPAFQTKVGIVEKVFVHNPGLYAEIVTENPDIGRILDLYEKTLSELRSLIQQREARGLAEMMEKYAELLWPPDLSRKS